MELSLLIAAYKEQGNLPKLVNKLLMQDENNQIEIVISVDDNFDYKSILPTDSRIVYAESGLQTGPGAARNRALEKSTGNYIVLMDGDDDISVDYLRNIFDNLKKYDSFALKTVYKKDGVVVRKFEDKILNYNNFSSFYGSVHTVAPRDYTLKYLNVVAEDVLATLNVINKNNGSIPVIESEYIVNLHKDSYCSKNGAEFSNMYKSCMYNSFEIAKELGNEKISLHIKQLYNERLDMSLKFDQEIGKNKNADYHQFVIKTTKRSSNLLGRWY
jgi:glycosyltransferase involved in cell wall biosynthesis